MIKSELCKLLDIRYPIIQGGMAVSYTHLDVYKRQLFGGDITKISKEWINNK